MEVLSHQGLLRCLLPRPTRIAFVDITMQKNDWHHFAMCIVFLVSMRALALKFWCEKTLKSSFTPRFAALSFVRAASAYALHLWTEQCRKTRGGVFQLIGIYHQWPGHERPKVDPTMTDVGVATRWIGFRFISYAFALQLTLVHEVSLQGVVLCCFLVKKSGFKKQKLNFVQSNGHMCSKLSLGIIFPTGNYNFIHSNSFGASRAFLK